MDRLLVAGFIGLGDQFYQRPAVREVIRRNPDKKVTLNTFYPQFYYDMPELDFWYRSTTLRCPEKEAINRIPKSTWAPVHKRTPFDLSLSYDSRDLANDFTIFEGFDKHYKSEKFDPSFDPKPSWVEAARKLIVKDKILVLRQPTLRQEWYCSSRNPKPGIMPELVKLAKSMGYKVISIADIDPPREDFTEKFEGIDLALHKGETPVEIICALLAQPEVITLTTQGFAVPMSLAVGGKCFTVYGGYVGPNLILDPRLDLSNQGWVAPEPFCKCIKPKHECKKDIPLDYAIETFRSFVLERGSADRLLPGRLLVSKQPDRAAIRPELLPEVPGDGSNSYERSVDEDSYGDSQQA